MQVDIVSSPELTVNLGSTDNAVLDAMVVDLDAIETLLTGIDSDTDSIKGWTMNTQNYISSVRYADDADWTDGSSYHLLVGGLYQSSMQSITDGDVGPLQVDVNGQLKVALSATDNAVLDGIEADTGAIKIATEAVVSVIGTSGSAGPAKCISM